MYVDHIGPRGAAPDAPGAHGHSKDDFFVDEGLQMAVGRGHHHYFGPGGEEELEPGMSPVQAAAARGHRPDDVIEDGLMRDVGHGHRRGAAGDYADHVLTGGFAPDAPGAHGHGKDDFFVDENMPMGMGLGRHHIEAEYTEDHMAEFTGGDNMPQYPDHVRGGHGRKHFDVEDHIAPRGHIETTKQLPPPPVGRKHAVVADSIQEEVFVHPETVRPARVPRDGDMKDAIREWAETNFNLMVFNENNWKDLIVTPRGNHWTIEALTEQRKSISREAASAQLLAEKLSLMTVAELRHFGLRFRGPGDERKTTDRAPGPGACRKKRVSEFNPTMTSSGMLGVLGQKPADEAANLSFARRVPEEQQRRFIASGASHFDGGHVVNAGDLPGSHGRASQGDFQDGIERGIGHGKRNIQVQDHIWGGTGHHTPPGKHGQQRAQGMDEGMPRAIGHGRSYIGGITHMEDVGFAREGPPGLHGHSRADDYQDGIHRDIGQGRRHTGF